MRAGLPRGEREPCRRRGTGWRVRAVGDRELHRRRPAEHLHRVVGLAAATAGGSVTSGSAFRRCPGEFFQPSTNPRELRGNRWSFGKRTRRRDAAVVAVLAARAAGLPFRLVERRSPPCTQSIGRPPSRALTTSRLPLRPELVGRRTASLQPARVGRSLLGTPARRPRPERQRKQDREYGDHRERTLTVKIQESVQRVQEPASLFPTETALASWRFSTGRSARGTRRSLWLRSRRGAPWREGSTRRHPR